MINYEFLDPIQAVDREIVRAAATFLVGLESAELYDVSVALGLPPDVAEPIWRAFLAQSYIKSDAAGQHVPTTRMRVLAEERISSPKSRKKMVPTLRRIVESTVAANHAPNESTVYYVTRLSVFGSYVSENGGAMVSLDLGWELAYRGTGAIVSLAEHLQEPASLDSLRKRIFTHNPRLRIVPICTLDEQNIPYKIIYKFDAPLIAKAATDNAEAVFQYDIAHGPLKQRFSLSAARLAALAGRPILSADD